MSRRERRRLAHRKDADRDSETKDNEQEEVMHDGSNSEGSSDEQEAAENSGNGKDSSLVGQVAEHSDKYRSVDVEGGYESGHERNQETALRQDKDEI